MSESFVSPAVDSESDVVERLEDLCSDVLASSAEVSVKEKLSMVRAITAALEVTRGKVTQVVHRHEALPAVAGSGAALSTSGEGLPAL